ncbi:hypothetical protein BTN50_0164 [Candidatus Enterovibrio altilux]|uniref:Uncharacterized protein n=1 Tax=Candidatus Enterovibrio altilux TaxID=1927128 RepID=A0A291B6T9_9GAMM|nr:hypothetical protein BTN50_0164 [Candidatus Enterovibrio luxaltus]
MINLRSKQLGSLEYLGLMNKFRYTTTSRKQYNKISINSGSLTC